MATKRISAERVSKLVENAIALSADVHGSREFPTFRPNYGERMQGFVGIYSRIHDMAEALTDYETRKRIQWGIDERYPEWIEVIEALAGEFLRTGDVPDVEEIINRIPK